VEALCALESFVVNCSKTSWWWTARDMVLRHCVKSRPKDPHSMPWVNWVRFGDLRKNKGAGMTRKLAWHAWCRGAAKGLSLVDRFERMCMPPQTRGIFHLGWTCPMWLQPKQIQCGSSHFVMSCPSN
jgi:hypothetical protein